MKACIGSVALAGALAFAHPAPADEDDRCTALAGGFLGGPLAAHVVMANFDYDGDGVLERREVFVDLDEATFVALLTAQAGRLPGHAGELFARAVEIQDRFELGGHGPAEFVTKKIVARSSSFELRSVAQSTSIEDGTIVVVVSGKVENVLATVKPSPDLVAEFRHRSGGVLKSQTFGLVQGRLGSGESVEFSERVLDVPRESVEIMVSIEEND